MKVLGWLVVLALVAAAVVGYVVLVPFGPSSETYVQLQPGTSGEGVAGELERAGVVRSMYVFDLLRVVARRRIKAGEYRFDHPVPMTEVLARLVRGDVYTKTLVIPEGYNIFDVAAAVDAAGLGNKDEFLAAEREHTELIQQYSPRAVSLEGYLFPATYRFQRHQAPEVLLAAMVKRFGQAAAQAGLGNADDIARTVTMASLVEKEVRVDSERPLVAGVFINRLAQGMPLATDPTVIYAAMLAGRYRGTIYQSDLQYDSPYNTYKHAGLPPGPICNPGMAALKAAIRPAATDYLYFVADAAGHSRFSVGMKEHDAQVKSYREAEKAMRR